MRADGGQEFEVCAVRIQEAIGENHRSATTAEESILDEKGAIVADIQSLCQIFG